MLNFYKNCITALKDSEYQVIMSVGNNIDPEKLGEIPSNFEVYHSVDQIAVLQKADAFLTHCGMNSVNEALYYEVPLILFPQTSEQGGVARQVSNMEAGIYLLKNNPISIQNAVTTVFNDDKYKKNASIIAESFKKSGGPAAAANAIIKVIQNKK